LNIASEDFSQADLREIVLKLSKNNEHLTCENLYDAIKDFVASRNQEFTKLGFRQ